MSFLLPACCHGYQGAGHPWTFPSSTRTSIGSSTTHCALALAFNGLEFIHALDNVMGVLQGGGGVSWGLAPGAAVMGRLASSGRRGCTRTHSVPTCGPRGCQRIPQWCGAPPAGGGEGRACSTPPTVGCLATHLHYIIIEYDPVALVLHQCDVVSLLGRPGGGAPGRGGEGTPGGGEGGGSPSTVNDDCYEVVHPVRVYCRVRLGEGGGGGEGSGRRVWQQHSLC